MIGGGPSKREFPDVPVYSAGDDREAAVRQRDREYRDADAKARQARSDEAAARRRVAEERAATDSHRHLHLAAACLGIVVAAVLEVGAAEPAAEALGFSRLLTYVITAILVMAVVGGAVMLAHSGTERRRFLLGFQGVVLAVLFGLRFIYLTAFEPLLPAFLGAAGLTLLTGVIYILVEELTRRAETVDLWQARRASNRAERRRRRLEKIAAHAEVELQKAVDARDLSRR